MHIVNMMLFLVFLQVFFLITCTIEEELDLLVFFQKDRCIQNILYGVGHSHGTGVHDLEGILSVQILIRQPVLFLLSVIDAKIHTIVDVIDLIKIHILLPAHILDIFFSAEHGEDHCVCLLVHPMLQGIQCSGHQLAFFHGTILYQRQRPQVCDLQHAGTMIFLCQNDASHAGQWVHRCCHDYIRLVELTGLGKQTNGIIKEIQDSSQTISFIISGFQKYIADTIHPFCSHLSAICDQVLV